MIALASREDRGSREVKRSTNQKVYRKSNWSVADRGKCAGPWSPFLEGPEKFSRLENRSKISNLLVTKQQQQTGLLLNHIAIKY